MMRRLVLSFRSPGISPHKIQLLGWAKAKARLPGFAQPIVRRATIGVETVGTAQDRLSFGLRFLPAPLPTLRRRTLDHRTGRNSSFQSFSHFGASSSHLIGSTMLNLYLVS